MRYSSRRARAPRRANGSGGPPALLVFLIGVALVFGLFYLWQGVQNFFRTGGLGVNEATQRAQVVATATSERVTRAAVANPNITPRASNTPVPECKDFVVSVPNAIVREAPASGAAIVTSYNEGETVCVLEHNPETGWYSIDMTPNTRRLDLAYMHETVIRAANPTMTPSITPTPLPTVTPLPSDTPPPAPPTQPRVPPTETPASLLPEGIDVAPLLPTQPPPVPSPTNIRQSA